ncbi:MAG: tetratricopeptide repeat protein [Bacteroidetes bacterium]|nr:tetratricopeptide repeat protein [Bacteroidota bacterium]
MKNILLFVLALAIMPGTKAQSIISNNSSATDVINSTSEKNFLDLANHFLFLNTDSSIKYVERALLTAKKMKSEKFEADALYLFAGNYWITGDYSHALNAAIDALRIYEKLGNKEDIANAYRAMASIFRDQGDYDNAILYSYKCKELAENIYPATIYTIIGSIYEKFDHYDSAMRYMNAANEKDISVNGKNSYGYIPYILGNIYAKKANYDTAIECYKKAATLTAEQKMYKDLMEIYNGMAKLYRNTGKLDSSIYYAEKTLETGRATPFLLGMLTTSSLLTEIYKSKKNNDSTIKYLELNAALKDTLFNQEKSRHFQYIAFTEQMREQELEEERLKQAETRKHNLQLAGIAAFIPIFFLIILALSRKKIKSWVIEMMGIIGLLLLFEFISLLLHPKLEAITNETPILMILALTAIAGVLVPMHHRLEKWFKKKLMMRNTVVKEEQSTSENQSE